MTTVVKEQKQETEVFEMIHLLAQNGQAALEGLSKKHKLKLITSFMK